MCECLVSYMLKVIASCHPMKKAVNHKRAQQQISRKINTGTNTHTQNRKHDQVPCYKL